MAPLLIISSQEEDTGVEPAVPTSFVYRAEGTCYCVTGPPGVGHSFNNVFCRKETTTTTTDVVKGYGLGDTVKAKSWRGQ